MVQPPFERRGSNHRNGGHEVVSARTVEGFQRASFRPAKQSNPGGLCPKSRCDRSNFLRGLGTSTEHLDQASKGKMLRGLAGGERIKAAPRTFFRGEGGPGCPCF